MSGDLLFKTDSSIIRSPGNFRRRTTGNLLVFENFLIFFRTLDKRGMIQVFILGSFIYDSLPPLSNLR
jgi:hypothetical protein